MDKHYRTGIIKCGKHLDISQLQDIVRPKNQEVTKVLIHDHVDSPSMVPGFEFVKEKEQFLQDDDINLVVICNPRQTDYSLVAECLKAKKQVQILE